MRPPPSIVRFERLYLASLVVGLVATAASWSGNQARLAADPGSAPVATWALPAVTATSVLIVLLLWYFVARRASLIAKWVMVVWTVAGVLFALPGVTVLVTGRSPNAFASILSLAATALQVAAAAMLFRDDARAWFGEGMDLPPGEIVP